jgi:hypothetical protein
MKLVELVKYFRNGGTYEEFCLQQSLNLESEVIEIYTEKPFRIDNELAFFEIENTEGRIEYTLNEVKYFNIFDFYYFLDAMEESNNIKHLSLSDDEIANRLYNYAINDA